jgi:hypothetical protein
LLKNSWKAEIPGVPGTRNKVYSTIILSSVSRGIKRNRLREKRTMIFKSLKILYLGVNLKECSEVTGLKMSHSKILREYIQP